MNRPIGPADAPLATKLASLRPELAALQTEVGTSLPAGAVAGVQQVKNDVRLPSHALLEAVLPAVAPAAASRADAAPPSVATQWSAAARAISAVLADLHAEPEPVRGAAPLWPSAKAPAGTVLAGALAQTVSGSGLFYESHLLEFANGLRTLAQLAEEPQVRLTQPALAVPAKAGTAAAQQPGQPAAGQPLTANPLFATAAAGQPIPAASPSISTVTVGQLAPSVPGQGQQPMPVPVPPGASTQVLPAAAVYTHLGVPAASAVQAPVLPGDPGMALDERAGSRGAGENNAAASSARAAAPGATVEVIHPQTVALVHQQLDLLATSHFRWSGEAWPNVPMEWSIHEEADQPADASGDERNEERSERPRRWATTVSLTLPKLGAVDLRLSLTGELVQAHLAASEAATLARLRSDGNELGPRLEAAGLRLQDLQITAMGPLEHAA